MKDDEIQTRAMFIVFVVILSVMLWLGGIQKGKDEAAIQCEQTDEGE